MVETAPAAGVSADRRRGNGLPAGPLRVRILQRYVADGLLRATALTLLALLSVMVFLTLIDQLEDAGAGNYDITRAVLYVTLSIPRLVYETLPIAALIGAMAALAVLSRNNELDVIRLGGASRPALAALLGKAALVLALVSILLGEFIAPAGEKKALHLHADTVGQQVVLQGKSGFWLRDGASFINVRGILPQGRLKGVYIYEFDGQHRLRRSVFAKRARYVEAHWVLEQVRNTVIDETGARSEQHDAMDWETWFDPRVVDLLALDPGCLPLWDLYRGIALLEGNLQDAAPYRQAFYEKLTAPLTVIAMTLLAIPLVLSRPRSGTPGQYVFTGALVGVVFYLLNSAAAHAGAVYGLPPALSAPAPTLLLLSGLGGWLLLPRLRELIRP